MVLRRLQMRQYRRLHQAEVIIHPIATVLNAFVLGLKVSHSIFCVLYTRKFKIVFTDYKAGKSKAPIQDAGGPSGAGGDEDCNCDVCACPGSKTPGAAGAGTFLTNRNVCFYFVKL